MLPSLDDPGGVWFSFLVAAVLVHVAFRFLARRQRLVAIPTSAAGAVHLGLNRVHGRARPVGPVLVSPISETECVAWSCRVEDELRTESVIRWRRRQRWRTAAAPMSEADFEVVDGSGEIVVRTARAELVGRMHTRLVDGSDPLFHAAAAAPPPRGATGRRRITEVVVPLDQPVTVLGTARLPADALVPELGWDEQDRTLLVSSVGLAARARRDLGIAIGLLLGAAWFLGTTPWQIRPGETEYTRAVRDGGAWLPLLVAGGLLVVLGHWLVHVQRTLVALRQRVARAWSLISVEVARRHDLLPGLVAVAAGAAHHEQATLTAVAAARAAEHAPAPDDAALAGMRETDRQDAREVRQLVAVSEATPELRADATFLFLQTSVTEVEDRLALARGFYNDSVTLYEDHRARFPTSVAARLLGFVPIDRYEG